MEPIMADAGVVQMSDLQFLVFTDFASESIDWLRKDCPWDHTLLPIYTTASDQIHGAKIRHALVIQFKERPAAMDFKLRWV